MIIMNASTRDLVYTINDRDRTLVQLFAQSTMYESSLGVLAPVVACGGYRWRVVNNARTSARRFS